MKGMEQLWENARQVAQRALQRADSEVNGTARAQARYGALPDPARAAMRETVVAQFGKTAWDDFSKVVGGGDGG